MSTFINALFVLMWLLATSEQGAVNERIMGGHTISVPNTYGGYGVHVITKGYSTNGKNYTPSACGGTLISPRVIVSAQHCFVDPKNFMPAKEATFYINTTAYRGETGGITVSCKGCWDNHPGYVGSRNGSQNDLTVVTLPKVINVENIMLPVLPPKDKTIEDYFGKSALIVGWGLDEKGEQPQTLRGVNMSISSYEYCQLEQHNLPDHICAQNVENHTACSGDSGGGAVVDNVLIGVASFVYPSPQRPRDVCYKVAYVSFTTTLYKPYRQFIDSHLQEAEKSA